LRFLYESDYRGRRIFYVKCLCRFHLIFVLWL
jgi:hypothetical protein